MIRIGSRIRIPEQEVRIHAVRAQGPGGQRVNKIATAAHLRFDIRASSLPEGIKQRLLAMRDRRITREGEVVIKAQRHRTYERNRAEAVERLAELLRNAARAPKRRIATRPPAGAQRRRVERKRHRGRIKALRGPVHGDA
ncbi:MAG TPA: aminoacyl-tRNA hydrolase [Chromatiales bacterium]|nr:aminoacyl-tRNA hydrolase [Chromatiales bacterium]